MLRKIFELFGQTPHVATQPEPRHYPTQDEVDEYMRKIRAAAARNLETFKKRQTCFRSEFPGEFVAISNNELVDHDTDEMKLAKRVSSTYPKQFVLIQNVDRPFEDGSIDEIPSIE